MKKKILIWSVVSILVALVGGGLALWLWMPQTIVLGDGTTLKLLAVTYGKRHVLPKKYVVTHGSRAGTISTPNESLCLWVQQIHESNNYPNYQMMVFDGANKGCASSTIRSYASAPGKSGKEIVGLVFPSFPRRGGRIYFRARSWNNQEDSPTGQFSTSNPARGNSFPNWTPETLPITQKDDALQVTLTRLVYGVNGPNNFGQDPDQSDPVSRGVNATFQVEENGSASALWEPVQIDTSDATGNRSQNQGMMPNHDSSDESVTYQWGLWPDEPAWKLRVEMSRQSDFDREDVWTASDIPLKEGGMNDAFRQDRNATPFAETTINQIKLGVFPAIQFTGNQPMGDLEGAIRVHASPPPEGFRLTIVSITDDQGKTIDFQNFGSGGGEFRFGLKRLGKTKSISVTLALHRSRYFEFTAKPGKG